MHYLSSNNIVHRDLAARNCLLDDQMRVKVADFGLTKQIVVKDFYRSSGNDLIPLRWLAIETLESKVYTLKTDVWAYGVLIWEVMSGGALPYGQFDRFHEILFHLKTGNRLPKPQNSPRILYELCKKCWAENANTRPDFASIVTELEIIISFIRENALV